MLSPCRPYLDGMRDIINGHDDRRSVNLFSVGGERSFQRHNKDCVSLLMTLQVAYHSQLVTGQLISNAPIVAGLSRVTAIGYFQVPKVAVQRSVDRVRDSRDASEWPTGQNL